MSMTGESPIHEEPESKLADGLSAAKNPARIQIYKSTPTKRVSQGSSSTPSPTKQQLKVRSEANKLLQLLQYKKVQNGFMLDMKDAFSDHSLASPSTKDTPKSSPSNLERLPLSKAGSSFHNRISKMLSNPSSPSLRSTESGQNARSKERPLSASLQISTENSPRTARSPSSVSGHLSPGSLNLRPSQSAEPSANINATTLRAELVAEPSTPTPQPRESNNFQDYKPNSTQTNESSTNLEIVRDGLSDIRAHRQVLQSKLTSTGYDSTHSSSGSQPTPAKPTSAEQKNVFSTSLPSKQPSLHIESRASTNQIAHTGLIASPSKIEGKDWQASSNSLNVDQANTLDSRSSLTSVLTPQGVSQQVRKASAGPDTSSALQEPKLTPSQVPNFSFATSYTKLERFANERESAKSSDAVAANSLKQSLPRADNTANMASKVTNQDGGKEEAPNGQTQPTSKAMKSLRMLPPLLPVYHLPSSDMPLPQHSESAIPAVNRKRANEDSFEQSNRAKRPDSTQTANDASPSLSNPVASKSVPQGLSQDSDLRLNSIGSKPGQETRSILGVDSPLLDSSNKKKRLRSQIPPGGPRVKLRSLNDAAQNKVGITENIIALSEVVVGYEDLKSECLLRSSSVPPKALSQTADDANVATLLRAESDDVSGISSVLPNPSPKPVDPHNEFLSPRNKLSENSTPVKGRSEFENTQALESSVLNPNESIRRTNLHLATTSPLAVNSGVELHANEGHSQNLTGHADPEADRKKIERTIARELGTKIASMNRLRKSSLVRLIQSGIVNHSPLRAGSWVTSSNNICNINNYEMSPVLYLQHLSKRGRLETFSSAVIEFPQLKGTVDSLDAFTKEDLMKRVQSAVFYVSARGANSLTSDEKAVFDSRLHNLRNYSKRLKFKLSDEVNSNVSVAITVTDFLDGPDSLVEMDAKAQIWSYAYALNVFELLTGEAGKPFEDVNRTKQIDTPPMLNLISKVERRETEVIEPDIETSRQQAAISDFTILEKKSLEQCFRDSVSQKADTLACLNLLVQRLSAVPRPENPDEIISGIAKCTADLSQEKSRDVASLALISDAGDTLRRLTSEVITDQMKIASLHGQISNMNSEITALKERVEEERQRNDKWLFVFRALVGKTGSGRDRNATFSANDHSERENVEIERVDSRSRNTPKEMVAESVLEKNVRENIHLIKNALRKNPESHENANITRDASGTQQETNSLSIAKSDTANGKMKSATNETNSALATHNDLTLIRNDLQRSHETLKRSMTTQIDLQNNISRIEADRNGLRKALSLQTKQLEDQKKESDMRHAQSLAVIHEQRRLVSDLSNNMDVEVAKRKAMSIQVEALIASSNANDRG
ncbi:LADA_0D06876g1_1 [Lachancea dasiensis]|uniref:LADA_0D06876g1_1 n=1 Tax=Lachancea dasiensis TaxID=1072105 RepID=A0A1G4J679_9SACH|nr:LADA_0D06876g1_1 [Lachancea dasiensis]